MILACSSSFQRPCPGVFTLFPGRRSRTMSDRSVFFVSDGTGITAETLGNSILAQFAVKPRHVRRPFIDTVDKAFQVVREINAAGEREGKRPVVFTTLANDDVL